MCKLAYLAIRSWDPKASVLPTALQPTHSASRFVNYIQMTACGDVKRWRMALIYSMLIIHQTCSSFTIEWTLFNLLYIRRYLYVENSLLYCFKIKSWQSQHLAVKFISVNNIIWSTALNSATACRRELHGVNIDLIITIRPLAAGEWVSRRSAEDAKKWNCCSNLSPSVASNLIRISTIV